METLRATIRLGAYVFVVLSCCTSLLLVLGPVSISLRAVFVPHVVLRMFGSAAW